jgi:hypothetical protein
VIQKIAVCNVLNFCFKKEWISFGSAAVLRRLSAGQPPWNSFLDHFDDVRIVFSSPAKHGPNTARHGGDVQKKLQDEGRFSRHRLP